MATRARVATVVRRTARALRPRGLLTAMPAVEVAELAEMAILERPIAGRGQGL